MHVRYNRKGQCPH